MAFTCGATVNSVIKVFSSLQASWIEFSTSLTITCSPNAEIKCLIRPVTRILCGISDVKMTVSPVLYAHKPALVEIIKT